MNELLKKRLTEGVVYIYGLRDPRNGEFFYVGRTVYPDARLDSYRKPQHASSNAMREYLRELQAAGHDADMVLFEKADFTRAPVRENHHIDRLRGEGAALLNVARNQDGAISGLAVTEEKLEEVISEIRSGSTPLLWLSKRYVIPIRLLSELRREVLEYPAPTSTS